MAALLLAGAVACGTGEPGPDRAGDTVDTVDAAPAAAGSVAGRPDRSPMTSVPADSTVSVPLRGRYDLALVDGRDLPAATDRRPGCELQLTGGDLFLLGDDPARPTRFRLLTRSRERCGEEIRNERSWETTGAVSLEAGGLRLEGEATDPGQIGSASGRIEPGGRIVLTRLTGEAGPREIRWEFVRLHDAEG